MSGLSPMQTRTFINRLGGLDDEITKVCRASDVMAGELGGKDHAEGVRYLKEACKALEEKQKFVREAKDRLLGFDGFLHALGGEMSHAMAHPQVGSFFSQIAERMGSPLELHVSAIFAETVEGLRRVQAAVKALREAKEDAKRDGLIKDSSKALAKVCEAAESAIRKGIKHASTPEHGYEHMHASDEIDEEDIVEKSAGDIGWHGYSLIAALPPEFLENAQKKKDEAAAKKKKEDGDDDDKSDKKATSGYEHIFTAGLPPEFLENIQKKKDEAAAKKKDDDDDDEGEKKKAHGYQLTAKVPDFIQKKIDERKDGEKDEDEDEKKGAKKAHGYSLTADSRTPGNESKGPEEEGEEDQGYDPGHVTDEESEKQAGWHGYQLTDNSDHGYKLFG